MASESQQSGFDLGGAVNSAADWLSSAPIIHRIVNNPIYTALLITALVAVVALAMYRDKLKGKKALKALFYTFFLTSLVVFVHHYAMVRSARETAEQYQARDIFAGVQSSRALGQEGIVPVVPMGETIIGGSRWQSSNSSSAPASPPAKARDNVAPFGTAPGDAGELAIDDVEVPYSVMSR